jgi:hypothetical protein
VETKCEEKPAKIILSTSSTNPGYNADYVYALVELTPLYPIMATTNHDKGNATMPKYEIRCNTERVLEVEADDEQAARKIAEQTDFSDWDSADSLYSIETIESSSDDASRGDSADSSRSTAGVSASDRSFEPVNQLESAYTLRIDGELFRRQRELLLKIQDAVSRHEPYVPAANDVDLLEGATSLLDEIADQAHDQHGIDCLLKDAGED